MPVATAQCRTWLSRHLAGAEEEASPSTADAVRRVAEAQDPHVAAIGTETGGRHIRVGSAGLRDRGQQRQYDSFRPGSPARVGYPGADGTRQDEHRVFPVLGPPGQPARHPRPVRGADLNLTNLESRPTKKALGEYCFVMDIEGHIADEVVADCLRDLHATLPAVKFLGSYPAGSADGERRRQAASDAWRAADSWIGDLRSHLD